MPIKAYVGQMRSGKTYEVVTNVILNGLRDGRRVVSNIAGLNYQLICERLLEEGIPIDKIGKLVCVTHEQVEKSSFWRTDKDQATNFESFIQPGDLVALDEVWRFWKKRGDIDPRAMNFVRMHGHMTHPETGFICEIALISQLITDINENVRGVIQDTFRMTKLTAVGSDKSYRVDVFSGGSVAKSNYLRQEIHRYDAKNFPLYTSHSQKTGVAAIEKNIDTRGNILSGLFFKIFLPICLLLFIFAFYSLWGFFHPEETKKKPITSTLSSSKNTGISAPDSSASRSFIDDSTPWRVVGWFSNSSDEVVVSLVDSHGRSRLLYDPPGLKVRSWQISVVLPEGGISTLYTGSAHQTPPVSQPASPPMASR